MGGSGSYDGLNEVDAEEAEEVDSGSDEGNHGGKFGEGDDVERDGVADLVTPSEEKEVADREEESEENGIGEVERQREGIGGFGRGGLLLLLVVVVGFERFNEGGSFGWSE